MKRILAIALAILIPLLVLSSAALALYRPGPPAEVQDRLNRYLALSHSRGVVYTVANTEHARWPERLTTQMSSVTYGNGYFCTTYLDEQPDGQQDNVTPVASSTAITGASATGSLQVSAIAGYSCTDRALPYPPRAAWCFTLRASGSAQETIVVARHDDIYVSRWVTHELRDPANACTVCGCGGS